MVPCASSTDTTWRRDSWSKDTYTDFTPVDDDWGVYVSNTALWEDTQPYKEEEEPDKYWRQLELEEWMRYSWNFIQYKMFKAYILPNVKILIRRMNLSYSGWLGRKGYKKKRGK